MTAACRYSSSVIVNGGKARPGTPRCSDEPGTDLRFEGVCSVHEAMLADMLAARPAER